MIVELGDGVQREPTGVVTVGTFDGVHLGHRRIIEAVVRTALDGGGPSTVVTFEPHPREVTSGRPVQLLSTIEERRALLHDLAVERTIVIPFTRAFAALPPERFVEDVIVGRIGCRAMVTGHDHSFGRARAGDTSTLEDYGRRLGFSVTAVAPVEYAGEVVSSTVIRRLVGQEGKVDIAAGMLGRRYAIESTVVRGEGRGRTIGFPTANLDVTSARKVIPARGVYTVTVRLPGREPLAGMMNIGVRPTFGGTAVRLEVHILDFDEMIYGQPIHLEFVGRLRDERRFASVDDLVTQLSEDRRRCRDAVGAVS